MTTQQLFYERAVQLSTTRHGDWSLEALPDFGFARNANSVPLLTSEFASAAAEYPIVFVPTQGAMVAAALLGPRAGRNLYVGADGAWRARYVPAFVRRYPFAFASGDDPKALPLCVDEACPGFNQAGRGERLFDDQRKPTPFLQERLKFVYDFQVQFDRTLATCRRVKELGLLEAMQAKLTLDAAGTTALSGYFDVVGRDRLEALPAKSLAADELELIRLHLRSLPRLATMGGGAAAG
ncbi:MAG: SapC family protein [Burkholderiaceae bacterium]|nr:SapC family protein [Burkholderiaceae bacterium]